MVMDQRLIDMSNELRKQYKKALNIGQEVLYLSEQDCKDTGTTVAEIIAATEQGMIEYSKRAVEMPAKIGIHPMPDCLMHAMPAYIPSNMPAASNGARTSRPIRSSTPM